MAKAKVKVHNAMGHIPVIDSLRGVAALLVCLYHFVCTTADYIYDDHVLSTFHLGYYGVHIFFVISGIVIPLSMLVGDYSPRSFLPYIAKRFIRIEPPYLFSLVLAIGYLIARNHVPGTAPVDLTPDVSTVLLHLGYLIPFFDGHDWLNNVYWSLAVEFQYYLLLCLVFPLLVSSVRWRRILTYVLLLTLALLTTRTTSMLPVWLPLFMVGISYVLWRFDKIDLLEFALVQICSLCLVYYYIDIEATIFGGATLALVHFAGSWRNKISAFFGNISYSLYLVHTIIGSAIINYLSHSYRLPWQKPIVIIIGLSASIFAAYVMYLLIEKRSKGWASRVKF